MPGPSDYTSLEALLLFQYLTHYGISLAAFTAIAQRLNDDPQIQRDSSFDPSRLRPDHLRDFFLRVWKDESKHQELSNGAAPTSPRKRKAVSPPLPTLQDAANNIALLPKFIIRLYGRYREQVVLQIRDDERRYHGLQEEIVQLRDGAWDSRLQRELDDRRAAQALDANGTMKSLSSATAVSLLAPDDRRMGKTARSPSPNSTTIELPKTIPRPPVQLQPSQSNSASGRPLAAQPVIVRQKLSTEHQRAHAGPTSQSSSAIARNPVSQARNVQAQTSPSMPSNGSVGTGAISQSEDAQPLQAEIVAGNSSQQVQARSTLPMMQLPVANSNSNNTASGTSTISVAKSPPRRGGVMLPPFHVTPQIPAHKQQRGQQDLAMPPLPPSYTQPLAAANNQINQNKISTPMSVKIQHAPSPLVLSISKMLSNPSLNSTPVSSPGRVTRSTETKWKDTPASGHTKSPTRPRSRSVSPISETDRSPNVVSKAQTRRAQGTVSTGQRTPAVVSSRAGRPPRKTRGASVASSAIESSVRGRTRSQSVLSHVSVDLGPKVEPSTPNETMELDLPHPSSTRRTTRGKRKRSPTATSDIGEPVIALAPPLPIERTSVFAIRNFQRSSNAVMNDIMSHKHASIFSHPVRDRDADGYSSIIRRPTDLKSIKVAVGAGARAVNATNLQSDHLPWSEDLVPPKGIVNSAQLEREVMRMFANAVMFNPGEDDVVRDAREMCKSAEQSLMNFKSAEQRTESLVSGLRKRAESEASQGAHEDDVPVSATLGKRRKLA